MKLLKALNALVAFLVELAMLAMLSYSGFHLPLGPVGQWIAGILLPLAVIIVWGAFLAPRSDRRLSPGPLAATQLLLFLATAVLYILVTGDMLYTLVFLVPALASTALAYFWKQ